MAEKKERMNRELYEEVGWLRSNISGSTGQATEKDLINIAKEIVKLKRNYEQKIKQLRQSIAKEVVSVLNGLELEIRKLDRGRWKKQYIINKQKLSDLFTKTIQKLKEYK